jgi:AhpC/TSA family protein
MFAVPKGQKRVPLLIAPDAFWRRTSSLTIFLAQFRFYPIMKSLLCLFIAAFSAMTVAAQSPQSPLAPPNLPPRPLPVAKLKVGDTAPDFGLPNGDGKLVLLSEYISRSPVVLVFYRGFW